MTRKDPHAVALGRKGWRKGGLARAAALTAEQRRDVGRLAAQARWATRRLPLIREAKGETSAMLAATLGITEATLASLETGRRANRPLLERIARRYHVNLTWLASGKGPVFDSEKTHYLGNVWTASWCQAGARIMRMYPASLEFSQIGYHVHPEWGGDYGWVFRLDERRVAIILPGEEKPGPMIRVTADFITAGHRFLGRRDLTDPEEQMLEQRTAELDDVLKLLRPPLRYDFPEVPDLEFLLPKQRAVLQGRLQALRRQEQGELSPETVAMIQELISLLKESPEVITPLLRMVRQHAASVGHKGCSLDPEAL